MVADADRWGGLLTTVWLVVLSALAVPGAATSDRPTVEYTNHFAVVVRGGRVAADQAAQQHGCTVLDSIGDLTDHYLLECHTVHKRSTEQSHHHIDRLKNSDSILWADQQYYKKRKKRDGAGFFPSIFDHFPEAPFSFQRDFPLEERQREHMVLRSTQAYWPDPLFKEQWYLNGGAKDGSDMNVIPAWQQGYSGKGVVVSILDDGIQPDHPDLSTNYDPLASLDINDNDDDPTPRDDGTNRHGTRCAGEVAAVAGNTVCGVGVAPNASIGGVRMLDGGVNDYVEAKALSYRRNHIDVYSASWGPEDDGKTVDGPGPLARRAFIEGVLKGRDGRGSIFVWASGNGGQYVDNCNCDGYTNSIFTLSISSASQGGNKPWYLEECASTLATTYSSGTPLQDKSIATCDQDAALRPKHICTVSHTGTSASAPLAAGICALALEANPSLTWRDMQYIVLMTSRYEPLSKEIGWLTNGVGRNVSHKFGYGLMDASGMVELAKRWTSVPAQHICITPIDSRTRMIPNEYGGQLRVSMEVNACQGTPQMVNYLEHVQCKVTLTYVPRGNLRILLTSPSGTVTTLLFERPRDVTGSSFDRWPFMSVHFWGENPRGVWNLTIINTHTRAPKIEGVLKEWQLILYGTETEPIRLKPVGTDQFGAGSIQHSSLVVGRSGDSLHGRLCSLQCVHACDSQPSGNNCKRCREQYKSDCALSCDPGTYYSEEGGCQPCHASCGTCFGGQQNQCLDCARDHYLITDLSVCVAACLDGYYTVNQTCHSCGPHCTSCVGSSSHCLSCASHLILYNNQCVASCPPGSYEINQRCELCAPGCETCVGPNDNNCVLCKPGLAHVDGQCVQSCPEGTHWDAGGECLRCPLGCATCSGQDLCLSCDSAWQLVETSGGAACLVRNRQRCSNGKFYSGGLCRPCHPSCHTCSGPMSVECTRCKLDTYLHNGLCYRDCPEGYTAVDGVCVSCHHTCLDCRSQQQCSECKPGLVLHNATCLAACPNGTYRDADECVPCSVSCLTCYGSRTDECVTCHEGWLLAAGACHTTCPTGHFRTPAGCQRCHRTCRTCTGSDLHSCTSCHTNYQLFQEQGTCLPCGVHEFFHPETKQCRMCHSTCGTCSGPGTNNCKTCTGDLRLELPQRRCLPCCDSKHHWSGTRDCCSCDPKHRHCVRGTRRRTAKSYSQGGSGAPVADAGDGGRGSTLLTWFHLQATVWCAASVLVFVIIFSVLQYRSRSDRRRPPVLELSDAEEHLALTEHQHDYDHHSDDPEEEHLIVYDSRT